MAGYRPRDPFAIEPSEDFLAATRRSIKGWQIAYSPDLDVFPVDPAIRALSTQPSRAFAEAGAVVEEMRLGLKRNAARIERPVDAA